MTSGLWSSSFRTDLVFFTGLPFEMSDSAENMKIIKNQVKLFVGKK